jgi:NTE family protein
MNIYGNSYIKGRVGVDVEVYRKNHLNFYANYANIGNNIFDKLDTWFDVPEYTGYAVGYGLETVIGPIELKYSWSPEGRKDFFWVNVGFWF